MADYTYLISSDGVFVAAEGKSWNVPAADRKKMEDVLRLIKEGAGLDRLKEKASASGATSSLTATMQASPLEPTRLKLTANPYTAPCAGRLSR